MQNVPTYDCPDGIVRAEAAGIQQATVTLTAAQVNALYTTAINLVKAPGAGKVLEFVSAVGSYVAGGTAFTIGSATNFSIKYKDKGGADVSSTRAATGFIDQSTSQYSLFRPLTAQLALDTNAVNQPLCLALVGGNPSAGTGKIKVNVMYRTYTL